MRYIIYTSVKSVSHEEVVIGTELVDGSWQPVKENRGWFVLFDGSWEKIYFGEVKPEFEPGDIIKLTFEKMPEESING